MKRSAIISLLLVTCFSIHAQIKPKTSTIVSRPSNIKTLPPQKAVMVRKDVIKLKVQLVELSDSISVAKTEIDQLLTGMKINLDTQSEMGETESLRLQMAMDRLSKMMSTLSNLMKKISDTDQGITQNLK